jgi:K+-sensing histidine kinase KdpD
MSDGLMGWTHKGRSVVVWARKATAKATRPDLIAPILLSIAAILLTSLLIREAHAHLTALQIQHDADDLALAYILPTIFITVLFGSNIGVLTALVSVLAAAYFVYPPEFSFAINGPENVVELGFFLALSVTASKSTAILTDENPLYRRPTRKLDRARDPALYATSALQEFAYKVAKWTGVVV